MHEYKLVSLIPARGSSERIPKKNIKMMAGKPMIAWSIEASLKSKYVNRTFVSTEDPEIKEVAIRYGAEVIDRPKKYASDNDGFELIGTLQHFKETLWGKNYYPDYLTWLYPTCPLRTAGEIDGTYELMLEKRNPMVMTAIEWENSNLAEVYWEKDEDGNWFMPMGYPSCEAIHLKNAKERKPCIRKRYIITCNAWIAPFRDSIISSDTYNRDVGLYIIVGENIDVDTPFDFKVAEMLLEERIDKKLNV